MHHVTLLTVSVWNVQGQSDKPEFTVRLLQDVHLFTCVCAYNVQEYSATAFPSMCMHVSSMCKGFDIQHVPWFIKRSAQRELAFVCARPLYIYAKKTATGVSYIPFGGSATSSLGRSSVLLVISMKIILEAWPLCFEGEFSRSSVRDTYILGQSCRFWNWGTRFES